MYVLTYFTFFQLFNLKQYIITVPEIFNILKSTLSRFILTLKYGLPEIRSVLNMRKSCGVYDIA